MHALLLRTLFCVLVVLAHAHESASLRRLRQQEQVKITTKNVDALQTLIANAEEGTTFLFTEDVQLVDQIIVNATGLTFRGSDNSKPTLLCAEGKGALLVTKNTTIENLIIRLCQRTAVAVQHEGVSADPFAPRPDIKDVESIEVAFQRVDFIENDGTAELQSPGAILAKEKSMLNIEDCSFEHNKAETGGAIAFSGRFLAITSSSFVNNTAETTGGAIYASLDRQYDVNGIVGSKIQIRQTKFRSNKVLFAIPTTQDLRIQNTIDLESNRYFEFKLPGDCGGAIYSKSYETVEIVDVAFEDNEAVSSGGAIYINDNDNITIATSFFISNAALLDASLPNPIDFQLGGAIFAAFTEFDTTLNIRACRFENNTAGYGGAVHLVGPSSTTFDLYATNFTNNVASLGGGAIVFRNVEGPQIQGCGFRNNSAFVGGAIFVTNGGGMSMPRSARFKNALRTEFEDNVAFDGGAIFAMGSGTIEIDNAFFRRNKAERNGGGICVIDSRAGGTLNYQDARMYENAAYAGGAIYMENLYDFNMNKGTEDPNFELANPGEIVEPPHNELIENTAVVGGAIYYQASNLIRNDFFLLEGRFERNVAVPSKNEVFSEPLQYPRSNQSVTAKPINKKDSSAPKLLDLKSTEACEPGGGGAICLILSAVSLRSPANIDIRSTNFTENKAVVGGAIVVSTDIDVRWTANCNSNDTSTASILSAAPCRRLSLEKLLFENNTAQFAGGAIAATYLNHLFFTNEEDSLTAQSIVKFGFEKNFKDNSVSEGGYGQNVAGAAVTLEIFRPKQDKNSDVLIDDQPSGSSNFLPTINVELLDELDQRVTGGIVDSGFAISAESIEPRNGTSIASGQVLSEAVRGVATFETLALSAPNGTYELVFSVNNDDVKPAETNVTLRDCILGERYNPAGYVCERCTYETFTIYKDVPKCESCPSHAKCAGNASWVPEDGYWHSSPLSVIMLECLNDKSCKYENRSKKLETKRDKNLEVFIKRFEESDDPTFANEEYPQCEAGYEGPLCGSCEAGYGHANGKMCVQCGSRSSAIAVVFLLAVWQLVLIAVTIRSALVSIRDMGQLLLLQQTRNLPQFQLQQATTVTAPVPAARATASGVVQLPMDQNDSFIMHPQPGISTQGSFNPSEIEAMYSSRQLPVPFNMPQPTAAQQHSADYIVAAQNISETIKIFVNFFQITSVAVNINLEWTDVIKNMLGTMNSIAGFSNGSSFTPMICAVNTDSEKRSIYGLVLRIAFPLGLMVFVMGIFVLQWAMRLRSKRPTTIAALNILLKSRLIITFLVVGFYSYRSISEDLMTIVSCIRLDEPEKAKAYSYDDPGTEVMYSQYSIANGRYWTEDTGIKCNSRPHTYLVGFLGVPGIVLFLCGIPLYLFVFLLVQKSKGNLTNLNVLNTYGFIYQNYTEKVVYWEVVILMRKALIGAVVVFAYPLGSNLQGIMALGILIVSLGVHLIATPFRYFSLNVLEALSLMVSIFTFYSGVVFNDENTTATAKVFLSVLGLIINAILVSIFILTIFHYGDKYITAKLRYHGQTNIPSNPISRMILLFTTLKNMMQNRLQTIRSNRPQRRQRRNQRQQNKNVQMQTVTPTNVRAVPSTPPSPNINTTVIQVGDLDEQPSL